MLKIRTSLFAYLAHLRIFNRHFYQLLNFSHVSYDEK
nr:MAG TPA: hypothetical protein [Caudoviricetes sp.]